MRDKFAENLNKIKTYLEANKIPIVRFLYTENDGKIASLTVPMTKVLNSTIDKMMAILTIRDKLLYPDSSTIFGDPCSVQENLCVIGNFEGDARDAINDKKIDVNTTVSFGLPNDTTLDCFHDLRNELALEGIKAGIDITCHYTTDNRIQSFRFDSSNLLNLGDSLQKIRFLIHSIVGSYGQTVGLPGDNDKLIFRIKDGRTITTSIEINPYLLVKDW